MLSFELLFRGKTRQSSSRVLTVGAMKPVLIAGGGIGGMTLAHALKKARIPVLVLEQSKEFRRMGGGIGLWGPALMAFKQLDLEEKLEGKYMSCAGYRKDSQVKHGEWLVRPDSVNLKRHTSCLCLYRGDLQQVLYEDMDENEILFDAKVVSFIDKEGEDVRVLLDNDREVTGSMLIGADGIDSAVRQQLFPQIIPQHCGYYYLQGVGKMSTSMMEEVHEMTRPIPAFEAWGQGIRFGMVPLRNSESFWFVCSDIELRRQDLGKALLNFGSDIQNLVEKTSPEAVFSSNLRDVRMQRIKSNNKWGSKRVVCLGDAVHAMAPNLAQGACLAIEDAMELAHQIYSLRFQQPSTFTFSQIEEAFLKYYTARNFRTSIVQFLVPLVHKIGSLSSPLWINLRDNIFSIFPASVKTVVFDLTHQIALGWSYTPPNLGQGLYHRLLGNKFMRKNQSLNVFHRFDVDRQCSGRVKVTEGSGVFAACLRALLSLPPPMEGKVSLVVHCNSDGSERWCRTFISENGMRAEFNTMQHIEEEKLLETFGPFVFEFIVRITAENSFDLHLDRLALGTQRLRIPAPKFLCPQIIGTTINQENIIGWKFCVKIKGPSWSDIFLGDILKYEGYITSI